MSREAAFSALFAAVSAAYPWGLASRRLKLWSEVPAALRPALFQLESGAGDLSMAFARRRRSARWRRSSSSISTRAIRRRPARARSTPRSTRSTRRSRPAGADLALGRQTLGGAVHDCKIIGVPVRDPGDLDGDGSRW